MNAKNIKIGLAAVVALSIGYYWMNHATSPQESEARKIEDVQEPPIFDLEDSVLSNQTVDTGDVPQGPEPDLRVSDLATEPQVLFVNPTNMMNAVVKKEEITQVSDDSVEDRGDAMISEIDMLSEMPFDDAIVRPFD